MTEVINIYDVKKVTPVLRPGVSRKIVDKDVIPQLDQGLMIALHCR